MAQNYRQAGAVMPWTNGTGAAVAAGDVVAVGALVGVALGDIANGATGQVALDGVWELPKAAALEIDQGDLVYWDADDEAITKTSAGNTLAGAAFIGAAAAAATVRVKLMPAVTVETYVPEDSYVTWTNGTGSDVDEGDVVVIGALVGVADADIASTAEGTVTIAGIATLPKNTELAIDQGDVVYWDAGDGELNKTAEGNTRAGIAVAGALAAAATVEIKLNA
ncbi:DUF2190 family protein [Desulfofustis limnaeus]|uniref:DUF2190 family protein n=1 Tax=Desulfofustis limnaeus TaxID=2740163 RepID=A0ABN6MCA4_9BACT|nr:DUF2190 family protein [Desulfofustis limnaeus]BDD88707.1 hypothetical protein DPPLL_30720 [Desulfofustis limnaeus]